MERIKRDFSDVKCLVVKIGSSSLLLSNGDPNEEQMRSLVVQLANLKRQGLEIVLVTSGSVGIGFHQLGFKQKPKNMPEKQAAAAVGQGILMDKYENLFSMYGVKVGQILVTREDFANRQRFLNIRNTFHALLNFGVIPIVNENDTVATEEIRFGDNDTLAARVAGLVGADLLLMLSDIDGLYDQDPRKTSKAKLLDRVTEITQELEQVAGGAGTKVGTGGMATKLAAAKMAMHFGLPMVLARASANEVILRIMLGEALGTVFWPITRMDNRKSWIAYSAKIEGTLVIDAGAERALVSKGKSLLPSGIKEVTGNFLPGSIVVIFNEKRQEVGRGIVSYSAEEIAQIKGLQTKDVLAVLGHCDYEEVIHRNNLALNK